MKRRVIIALLTLVFSLVLDVAFHASGHGHFFWSNIPAFFAVFGLLGCVAIILVSKWLGHYWLQRKEDYYDRKSNDRE